MAIGRDLFTAILAMDAYSRGYDQGLVVSGNATGTVMLDFASSALPNLPEVNASFFAHCYVANQGGIDGLMIDQKIILYRGADNLVLGPIYGWLVGGGSYSVSQAEIPAHKI